MSSPDTCSEVQSAHCVSVRITAPRSFFDGWVGEVTELHDDYVMVVFPDDVRALRFDHGTYEVVA